MSATRTSPTLVKSRYSFEDARELLTDRAPHDTGLLDAFDAISGATLALSPLLGSGALASLLPLVRTKNELVKAGRFLLAKLSVRGRGESPVESARRMQLAYTIVCHVSILGALSDAWKKVHEVLGLPEIPPQAQADPEDDRREDTEPSACFSVPYVTDGFSEAGEPIQRVLLRATGRLEKWSEQTAEWASASEAQQVALREAIRVSVVEGSELFLANLAALAREFPRFHLWLELRFRESSEQDLAAMPKALSDLAAELRSTAASVDVGLERISKALQGVSCQVRADHADRTIEAIRRLAEDRLDAPVLKARTTGALEGLSFPSVRDAFIPQAFQAVRYVSAEGIDDSDWATVGVHEDLGPYLAHTLSSPYSLAVPMLILGNPGAGKSLLSEVMASQFLGDGFFPIRIPLRSVGPDLDLQKVIEDWVRGSTGESCHWTEFSARLIERGQPPLLILDGYDELLQAAGQVFASLLVLVQRFQEREVQLGRGLRAVVTSRPMLMHLATIPDDAIVVRLLPFGRDRQRLWIHQWNSVNEAFFRRSSVRPFELPDSNDVVGELATEPLLLVMLALYDSKDNELSRTSALGMAELYRSILRQFVLRERLKEEGSAEFFSDHPEKQAPVLEEDLDRLGIAAIGMFNRQSLDLGAEDLNRDLEFFGKFEEPESVAGRPLTSAERLFGSFFFVHHVTAQTDRQSGADVFEFLHPTFGEFLAARLLLRRVDGEIRGVAREIRDGRDLGDRRATQRFHRAGALSPEWYALLSHSPLYSRPLVLELFHELAGVADAESAGFESFVRTFDLVVHDQLKRLIEHEKVPQIFSDDQPSPYPRFSMLGHQAVYSLNLILLRAARAKEPYALDVESGRSRCDVDPWMRIVYLWRSWHSLTGLEQIGRFVTVSLAERSRVVEWGARPAGAPVHDLGAQIRRVARAVGDLTQYVLSAACFGVESELELGPIRRAGVALGLDAELVARAMEDGDRRFPALLAEDAESHVRAGSARNPWVIERLLATSALRPEAGKLFESVAAGDIAGWCRNAPIPAVARLTAYGFSLGLDCADEFLSGLLCRDNDLAQQIERLVYCRRHVFESQRDGFARAVARSIHLRQREPELKRVHSRTAVEFAHLALESGDALWAHNVWDLIRAASISRGQDVPVVIALDYVECIQRRGGRSWAREVWECLLSARLQHVSQVSMSVANRYQASVLRHGNDEQIKTSRRERGGCSSDVTLEEALGEFWLLDADRDEIAMNRYWTSKIRKGVQNLLNRPIDLRVEVFAAAMAVRDYQWVRAAWPDVFGAQDPVEFGGLREGYLMALTRISAFVGDDAWMRRALEAWERRGRGNGMTWRA